jgi:hypothetical protein
MSIINDGAKTLVPVLAPVAVKLGAMTGVCIVCAAGIIAGCAHHPQCGFLGSV